MNERMTPSLGAAALLRSARERGQMLDFAEALLARSRWRHHAPGEPIVRAGDIDGGIHGLADGSLSVTTSLGPPDVQLTHIIHCGIWFGHMPITSRAPRSLTVVARTPAYVAHVEQAALTALLAAEPRFWQGMAQHFAEGFNIAMNNASDLTIRDSMRRLAATLLRVIDVRFAEPGGPVSTVISQDEIAAMANLSRTTANQLLGELELDGLVQRGYNRVTLTDTKTLRAIVDNDAASRRSRRRIPQAQDE